MWIFAGPKVPKWWEKADFAELRKDEVFESSTWHALGWSVVAVHADVYDVALIRGVLASRWERANPAIVIFYGTAPRYMYGAALLSQQIGEDLVGVIPFGRADEGSVPSAEAWYEMLSAMRRLPPRDPEIAVQHWLEAAVERDETLLRVCGGAAYMQAVWELAALRLASYDERAAAETMLLVKGDDARQVCDEAAGDRAEMGRLAAERLAQLGATQSGPLPSPVPRIAETRPSPRSR